MKELDKPDGKKCYKILGLATTATFDDVKKQIIISEKIQYFEPVLSVSTIKLLKRYFRESLVLEITWKDSIEFRKIERIRSKAI